MTEHKKALTNKKSAAAKESAAFVKRTEQLYINALEEMGAKYVDGTKKKEGVTCQ